MADPYDFEIEIPQGNATKASIKKSRGYGGDSSDDAGNSSSDDSISQSDDEDTTDSSKMLKSSQTARSTKPSPAIAKARVTSTSSNALDKAKSFLSKYSSKAAEIKPTTTSNSRRRSRIELSLDEDDLSMGFSDEDDSDDPKRKPSQQSKSVKKNVSIINSARKIDKSDDYSQNDNDDEEQEKTQGYGNLAVAASRDQTVDMDTTNIKSIATIEAPDYPQKNQKEYQSDDNEDEAVASFINDSDDSEPPPFNAPAYTFNQPVVMASLTQVQTTPAIRQSSVPSAVLHESEEDVEEYAHESLASESDYVEESGFQSSPKARTGAFFKKAHESGVYEEDEFEEESNQAIASTHPVAVQRQSSIVETTSEPNFDYSMDFSDDENAQKTTSDQILSKLTIPTVTRKESLSSSAADESDKEDEHSALLDSDENDIETNTPSQSSDKTLVIETQSILPLEDDHVPVPERNTSSPIEQMLVRDINKATHPQVDIEYHNAERTELALQAQSTASTTTAHTLKQASVAAASEVIPRPRARITIIRAYDSQSDTKAEMKDAATQFTGNHAAIQADLIPDGMHNLFVQQQTADTGSTLPPSAAEPVSPTSESNTHNQPTMKNSQPPPPPSSLLTNVSYNMDILKAPMATSTSIYRQQLWALQEQIQNKKRETERLVRDRMSFQYSTLRGTERFLAANRPQKLELWEALMRVDPTIDERTARDIARIARERTPAA